MVREAIDVAVEKRRDLALWLMAFSVLAWIPGGFSRFVVAKLLVTAIACAVGATVPSTTRLPRVVAGLLALGAGLFVVAALASSTPWSSLVGRWPRYEGLPALGVYAGSAWLGARLIGSDRHLARLIPAVAAASAVLGTLTILEAIGWSPLGAAEVTRTGSVLGNATDQGLVAMVFVLVLARPTIESPGELNVAGLGLGAVTVVLSGSRTALALTVVGLVVLALVSHRRLLVPLLGAVAALLAAAVAVPSTRDRLLNSGTVQGRWELWHLTGSMIGDHPVFGIGPSRFSDAIGVHETARWVELGGTTPPVDSPHNWVLQVWVAGGLPLLVCALALVAATATLGWRAARERPALWGVFVAVGGYGAAMLTGFTNPTSTCLAAFLAGILLARRAPTPQPGWVRPVAVSTAAVVALAMAIGGVSEIYLRSGITAAATGNQTTALSALDNANRLRAWDPDAAMLSAQALAGLADASVISGTPADPDVLTRGRALAERSLSATPQSYQSLVALGVLWRVAGEPDRAAEVLDRAIALFPLRPQARAQRDLINPTSP